MKAFELKETFGVDSLTITERAKPQPGPGQILLQMEAWSLNYRDLMLVKGTYNPKLRLPCVPLSDGAGTVAEVGPGVTRVKPGDRVTGIFMQQWIAGEPTEAKGRSALGGGGPGMLAEYVVLHEEGVVQAPEHLTEEEAATLPCAAVTAWHALITEGNLKAGDSVLVQGTGGVSLFALQFAKLSGARVIVTSSSDAKLERAMKLGASAGINYKTTPEWDKAVRQLTHDQGVDHVVEVGGAGTLPRLVPRDAHGRPHQFDRRSDRQHCRGQSDADLDEEHPRAGHLCGLARDVRGDEPGHRFAQASACRRPRISLCRGPGGFSVPGKRRRISAKCACASKDSTIKTETC